MGYRRKPKTFTLVFADPEMDGLEVNCRSMTVDEYLKMTELLADLSPTPGDAAEQRKSIDAADELFGMLGSKLTSWNLEDAKGKAVPATKDGLRAQEFDFVQQIVVAWMQGLAGVSPPLSGASGSGEISPEVPPGLESASRSLGS